MRGVVEHPQGLTYKAGFIDEAAEQQVLAFTSSLELEPMMMRGRASRRTVRHFGLRYDYGSGVLREGEPIPEELAAVMHLAARFAALRDGELVEAIVYDVIVGVSLGAAASTIQFRTDSADERRVFEQLLDPGSAYIMRDDVRDNWQHRIPPAKAERISVTFRSLKPR